MTLTLDEAQDLEAKATARQRSQERYRFQGTADVAW